MKTLYITIGAILATAGLGLLVWKKRQFLSNKLSPAVDKTKSMADKTWGGVKSTAGRVAKSASEMIHTERVDPTSPSQA